MEFYSINIFTGNQPVLHTGMPLIDKRFYTEWHVLTGWVAMVFKLCTDPPILLWCIGCIYVYWFSHQSMPLAATVGFKGRRKLTAANRKTTIEALASGVEEAMLPHEIKVDLKNPTVCGKLGPQ